MDPEQEKARKVIWALYVLIAVGIALPVIVLIFFV